MRDDARKVILGALLDRYERSSFFRDDERPTRRIMLDFYNGGKSAFPYYDIEQSDRRIAVNRAAVELAKEELISFDWMKGERDHIIARVWLNTDSLPAAYQAAGRKPKSVAIDRIRDEISSALSQAKSPWAYGFLQDAYDSVTQKRDTVNAIPADDAERMLLLTAISAIDQLGGTEYTERVFSLRAFGDSKIFERSVKSRLIRILRKYLDNDEDASDEDILRQVGLVKYPEQFEFCGNISFVFGSGIVDFFHLPGGGTVFSSDLANGRLAIDPSVKSIITIENRANYIEYIGKAKANDELAIYHGGQYSPRKRIFLLEAAKARPEGCKWYHWGDIDYGGFIMLSRLRREIAADTIPYRMDESELKRHGSFAAPIKAGYAGKLKTLKNRAELSDCYGCIDYMIENMIRLEQEAMLIEA